MNRAARPSLTIGIHLPCRYRPQVLRCVMKILLADTDKHWLRSCALWLGRRGDEVVQITTGSALNRALAEETDGILLLAPRLLDRLQRPALPRLAGAATGILWRGDAPALRGPQLGRLVLPHLPRPRTPDHLERQLHFLRLAMDTDSLALPQVGEVLGLAANGPGSAVQAFATETARLLSQFESAAAAGESGTWQRALHAWRGCAATMGASALIQLHLPEDVREIGRPAGSGVLETLRCARVETLELLVKAAEAFVPDPAV